MLGGGELNAMLWVIVVLGVNAALQQTLALWLPIQSNAMGREPKRYGGHSSPGV